MGVGDDRISALPDSILHHILSFLSTENAICTSILSKRWRWLWTCIPNLSFEYRSRVIVPETTKDFMNYVDRVLLLHDRSNIHKFQLYFDSSFCDEFRVNSWISTLVTRKLQQLFLDIYNYAQGPLVFPTSIYICQSLTVLRIVILNRIGFELPTSRISLPNLKLLDLRSAIFPNECITTQFFSSCPVLEHLLLHNCSWVNHKTLLISVPSLKFFDFGNPYFGENRDTFDVATKICAPNLERFFLYTIELVSGDMPSLLHAKIDIWRCHKLFTQEERFRINASMLLKDLVNVKDLEISADYIKDLPHGDLKSQLPIFRNLINLTVVHFCDGNDILSLLQIMPNLQSLVLRQTYAYSTEDFLITDVMETMPHCLLSRVKKVRIDKYFGCKEEFYLIKSLLKNAVALESMTIVMYRLYGKKNQSKKNKSKLMEHSKHILMLPRSSLSCVVEIFDNWSTMSLPRLDDETDTLKVQQ